MSGVYDEWRTDGMWCLAKNSCKVGPRTPTPWDKNSLNSLTQGSYKSLVQTAWHEWQAVPISYRPVFDLLSPTHALWLSLHYFSSTKTVQNARHFLRMRPSLKRRNNSNVCVHMTAFSRKAVLFRKFRFPPASSFEQNRILPYTVPYSWPSTTRGLTQTLLITRVICVRLNGFNVVSLNQNMQEHVPSQYDLKYYRKELSSHTFWSCLVRTCKSIPNKYSLFN